ncbi:unnamed protein product [Urochloa humidicola]
MSPPAVPATPTPPTVLPLPILAAASTAAASGDGCREGCPLALSAYYITASPSSPGPSPTHSPAARPTHADVAADLRSSPISPRPPSTQLLVPRQEGVAAVGAAVPHLPARSGTGRRSPRRRRSTGSRGRRRRWTLLRSVGTLLRFCELSIYHASILSLSNINKQNSMAYSVDRNKGKGSTVR